MHKKMIYLADLPDVLTPQHVADYLGISRRRVYEFCLLNPADGGLPSYTIGKSRKIDKADLTLWKEAQKQTHWEKAQ